MYFGIHKEQWKGSFAKDCTLKVTLNKIIDRSLSVILS